MEGSGQLVELVLIFMWVLETEHGLPVPLSAVHTHSTEFQQ